MFKVPSAATCESCHWFIGNGEDEYNDASIGECSLNPPVIVQLSDWYQSMLPTTNKLGCCSRWEPYRE